MSAQQPSSLSERQCGECTTRLDLTGWCPTCRDVVDSSADRRAEFLRQLDAVIAYGDAQPFRGRQKAVRALQQVRRQRSLHD